MRTCTWVWQSEAHGERRGTRCNRPHLAHGLCSGHAQRAAHRRDMDAPWRVVAPRVTNKGRTCRLSATCARPAWRTGLCRSHYLKRLRAPEAWSGPVEAYGPHSHEARVPLEKTMLPLWVREELDAAASELGLARRAHMARRVLRDWAQGRVDARAEDARRAALLRLEYGPQKRGPKGPRRAA